MEDMDDIPEEMTERASEVKELRETFYTNTFSSKTRLVNVKEANKFTMLKFWLIHYKMEFLIEPLIEENFVERVSIGGQGRKEIFKIHTPLKMGGEADEKKPRKKLFSLGKKNEEEDR